MRATRALIGTATILAAVAGAISAATPVPANRTGLVVHEWGTFSSFSGSDGIPAQFHPEGGSDLPRFVYSSVLFTKAGNAGTVSLETPVLYFYADQPKTVSVSAEFKNGVFTEWFPQAGRPADKSLTWTDISIRPGESDPLPTAPGPTRYYAAREVDAAPLAITTKLGDKEIIEREKFLFYRGVGNPKTPLTVKALGNGEFSLHVTGDAPIAAGLLMEAKAGNVRFRQIDPLLAGTGVKATLPAEWSNVEPLRTALVATLIRAGLYEKEARAMVKTWESAWFGDDGTRVLYLLPASWTDRTIPLKVTPAPDTLIRVMVGRQDILTPEREQELDTMMKHIDGAEGPERNAALAAFQKLGRFTQPAAVQARQRLAKKP